VPPINTVSLSFLSTPAVCTAANGSMTVYPTGGVMPYTYLWNTGTTTASITSRPSGSYTATVTAWAVKRQERGTCHQHRRWA
jgi:hypothetical protein